MVQSIDGIFVIEVSTPGIKINNCSYWEGNIEVLTTCNNQGGLGGRDYVPDLGEKNYNFRVVETTSRGSVQGGSVLARRDTMSTYLLMFNELIVARLTSKGSAVQTSSYSYYKARYTLYTSNTGSPVPFDISSFSKEWFENIFNQNKGSILLESNFVDSSPQERHRQETPYVVKELIGGFIPERGQGNIKYEPYDPLMTWGWHRWKEPLFAVIGINLPYPVELPPDIPTKEECDKLFPCAECPECEECPTCPEPKECAPCSEKFSGPLGKWPFMVLNLLKNFVR